MLDKNCLENFEEILSKILIYEQLSFNIFKRY